MTRPVALLLPLLFAASAAAQPPAVKLTLSPSGEPKPALRYELLTPGREKVAGNAVVHYQKAALARPTNPDRAKADAEEKQVLRWEEAATDKLPAAEVKAYLERYAAAFREVEYGTRCKACEWTVTASGPDALTEVLGTVQAHRELARLLALRVKLELAEKRFDDAATTLRTGIQYGKHIAEGPMLIQMLVGLAVTHLFLLQADEFVARPGAPNLYWAFSTLPRPLIDPRPGLDGEDRFTESLLPGLGELRKGPVSAERALDLAENGVKVLTSAGGEVGPLASLGTRLSLAGHAALAQADARKELVARGRGKAEVDAMPAVQAVFLNSFETYRELIAASGCSCPITRRSTAWPG
jgi:hypothetical protein